MDIVNVKTGLKEIYKGRLLGIIAAVCSLSRNIVFLFKEVPQDTEMSFLSFFDLVMRGASGILGIAAFILMFKGIVRTAKGESSFKKAKLFFIVTCISFFPVLLTVVWEYARVLMIVPTACALPVEYFCMNGARVITKDETIRRSAVVIISLRAVLLIPGALAIIFGFMTGFETVQSVLNIAGGALGIIPSIMFALIMKRSSEALPDAKKSKTGAR